MQFADLRLAEPILNAVRSQGYTTATAIQAGAIPPALEGRDVMGSAQTGTGKTAAFALPILQRLYVTSPLPQGAKPRTRCLILCPTRELANQIADGFIDYGKNLKLRLATVYGGVNQRPQVDALRRGADVIIATPGRFLDLMRQGHASLSGVETLVLDEADRMLDMGFIHDIRTIVEQLPQQRQTLFFSATMPREIRKLAEMLMKNPVTVSVAPVAETTKLIDEAVYFVDRQNKASLLAHLFKSLPMARSIIFTRTKHGADRVVRHLHARGIRAEAIHGNKTQNARQRALDNFKIGRVSMLVATDIASRGIDVDQVTHVVNYDLTHEPETYVHRIGRTGRAGSTGMALSFVDKEEMPNLRAIERLIGRKVPVKTDHPDYDSLRPVGTKADADTEREPSRHYSDRHADRRSQGESRFQSDRRSPGAGAGRSPRFEERAPRTAEAPRSHTPARPSSDQRPLHPPVAAKKQATPARHPLAAQPGHGPRPAGKPRRQIRAF